MDDSMDRDKEVIRGLLLRYLNEEEAAEISCDLFDILESLESISESKDKLVHLAQHDPENGDKLLTELVEIDVDLSHILWHFRSYRKKVNKVADAIGDDE